MLRHLMSVTVAIWAGSALAEAPEVHLSAPLAVVVPPQVVECGKTRSVRPIDPDVQAQGEGTIQLLPGESHLDRIDECCAAALSACTDKLARNIQTVTSQAQCTGCTCPDCGALSCQPVFELPGDLWGGGNIGFGDCTASDEETEENRYVSCWQRCWVRSGYWGAWPFGASITIGCSKCERGHRPLEPAAVPQPEAPKTLLVW